MNDIKTAEQSVLDDYASRVKTAHKLTRRAFEELKDVDRVETWRITRWLLDIVLVLEGNPSDATLSQ